MLDVPADRGGPKDDTWCCALRCAEKKQLGRCSLFSSPSCCTPGRKCRTCSKTVARLSASLITADFVYQHGMTVLIAGQEQGKHGSLRGSKRMHA